MHPPNVLLVDDKLSNLIALEQVLQSIDVAVHKAASAESALGILLQVSIDCMVLDVNMPGMDGLEFLRRLAADRDLKDIPVIMLTGSVFSDNETLKAYKYGAYDFLVKPVDSAVLCQKVQYLVRSTRTARLAQALSLPMARINDDMIESLQQLSDSLSAQGYAQTVLTPVLQAVQALKQTWEALAYEPGAKR